MDDPLRDEDVVLGGEGDVAEHGAEQAAPLGDEVEVVAVAVREVDGVGGAGRERGDDDVVVPEERDAGVEGGRARDGRSRVR